MNVIDFNSLRPPTGGAPRFEGYQHDAHVSFFVSMAPPGRGALKHRHPYEEIFVLLDGEIEAIVGGVTSRVASGNIVIIPANTWHEFKNVSDHPVQMVNIHPVPKMVQEMWDENDA